MGNINLQPGDYTTREEIKAYAEREGIELMEAYQRICDAFMAAGADKGEGLEYADTLKYFGWLIGEGVYYFTSRSPFTRHLTPDQILSAGKQEDLQSEKQDEGAAPKQIGELTVEVSAFPNYPRDLQEAIRSYLWMLDSVKDEDARSVIKSQITDLTDLQFKQLGGGV